MTAKKSNRKYHLRATLFSAVGYGCGFIIGTAVVDLLFKIEMFDIALSSFDKGRVVLGIILILLIAGIGGAIAGAIGGITISQAYLSTDRKGYMWRSALAFGISYAIVAIPLTLAFSVMAFYELAETSPIALMIPLAIMGAVFGLVSGFTLGILTVGRHTWRVVLVAVISFALGGGIMGRFLFSYLLSLQTFDQHRWYLYGGLFAFGAIGGGALGFLYSWLAHRRAEPALPKRFVNWFQRQGTMRRVFAVVGLLLLLLAIRALWQISPFTATDAPLSNILKSRTVDTHWLVPLAISDNAGQPAIFADSPGKTALTWVEGTDVYFAGANQAAPKNVSNSNAQSGDPQIVVDNGGNTHIIWTESSSGSITNILYSQCSGSNCTVPFPLSSVAVLECLPGVSPQNSQPTLAINPDDTLMAVWRNGEGNLLYSSWSTTSTAPSAPLGCIPNAVDGMAQHPRLAVDAENAFNLVFSSVGNAESSQIRLSRFFYDNWGTSTDAVGDGVLPEIFVDAGNQVHIAWCGPDRAVTYKTIDNNQVEEIVFPQCVGRPVLAVGQDNAVRLIWYAQEVEDVLGATNPNNLVYESFKTDSGWSDPAIVSQTAGLSQPEMAVSSDGILHLTWAENVDQPGSVFYTIHTDYNCNGAELSATGQAVLDTIRASGLRSETDIIPYCYNQFEQFMYAPNPLPEFSDAEPTPNGTFDKFADLAKTAQYEVVFATMWYDGFKEEINPGRVLGGAIAELYENLKANPERYPRGITVRLLLGNPPFFSFFPTFNSQETALMNDLYAAGVPELRNDEIGWNVEVARFSGSWPHSHTKVMIVDGKTVQAVGYNMQHSHLPKDHPSGKGKGRVDLGMQVTGPVAQSALRAYDDLWEASTHIYCTDISPNTLAWVLSCTASEAVANHVPEVMRYYIPENPTSNAFRIYRTHTFREGDESHASLLASATESIDIIHINFSLDAICALNILIEACNYNNSLDYMQAIMQAVEANDVNARILVSDVAWVGIENNIAIEAFENELEARGLSDNVEIRYFEQDMHIKSALVDNEFLVLGNQNFHYSAWGGGGSLAEFNLGVEDPQMVEDYQAYFNYYWDRATKRE